MKTTMYPMVKVVVLVAKVASDTTVASRSTSLEPHFVEVRPVFGPATQYPKRDADDLLDDEPDVGPDVELAPPSDQMVIAPFLATRD